MASGKDTPQYKAVQKSIEVITHHLVVSEDAKEDLRLKYIKHNWLAKHARPEASALVVMALGRIELDVKEYEEFIAILKDIAGMGQIVGILIGITLIHNICMWSIISNYHIYCQKCINIAIHSLKVYS